MSKYRKTDLNKIFKILLMVMLFAVSANSAFGLSNSIPVCANETSGHFRCMSNVITDAQGHPKIAVSPLAGYGPNDFLAAYSLGTGTSNTNKTIAIVDAYDQPNIFSDLTTYSKNYAIPSLGQCQVKPTSSLCFQKVNQTGGTSYPVSDLGWGLEISLDVEVAHAICENCNILLVEANSNSYTDLLQAFDTAAAMGANVISNSYGSSEFSSEVSFDSHFNLQGKAITFSSGDNGYGTAYPAASPYVTSVGGTTLQSISPHVETTWIGSGSGCSSYEPKPSFQKDAGCSMRTIADVSADADPNTGAIIYDSPYGGWLQVGGTSLSSPIIAGVYALGKGFSGYGNSVPYANGSYGVNLYDITSGNNGACGGSYLCTSGPGYDGPTGLGSPIGTGAFEGAQTTGILSVKTIPVSGNISVDGVYEGIGIWSGSVSAGSHTVSFGPVAGYTTPPPQTVTVSAGNTTMVTGTYVPVSTGTTISIASQTVIPGSTVTVPIMANNITNVAAYTISLTYNHTVVVVDSVGAGALGGVTSVINNVTGVTQMSAFSTTPQSGNVTLANVTLRAVGTTGQTSPLTLSITTLSDNDGNTIPATVINGTFSIVSLPLVINASRTNLAGVLVPTTNITTNLGTSVIFAVTSGANPVSGATVVVTQGGSTLGTGITNTTGKATITVKAPTNATVTATASMSGYISGTKVLIAKGDVSGDGQVNIIDALFIAQSTVGLRNVDKVVGDVSGDGNTNIVDALFIAQYTVGSRADPTTP
jgi:hypothetical protein